MRNYRAAKSHLGLKAGTWVKTKNHGEVQLNWYDMRWKDWAATDKNGTALVINHSDIIQEDK